MGLSRMYGLIRVLNLTAVGANRLPGSDSVGTQPQVQGGDITSNVAQTTLTLGKLLK